MLENNPKTDDKTISPKIKILLADDDNSIRRFIEIVLQKADYEVLSAEDGLEAMKIALSSEVAAIIADAVMPNLSGFDLCRILRQNPQLKNIPFIILSGLEQDANSSCQADAYLLKGNDLKDNLIKTLARVLDGKV